MFALHHQPAACSSDCHIITSMYSHATLASHPQDSVLLSLLPKGRTKYQVPNEVLYVLILIAC